MWCLAASIWQQASLRDSTTRVRAIPLYGPATTWPTVNRPGVVAMAKLSIEKKHATIASTTGMALSTTTAARGKAAGGTRRSPSADCEFSGMSENLVEAVATVATQPLINPSPKTT
jgi:hypothetical protein